ncbi:MAG: Spy/CpxP family protein refolding chaperone [Gemmatimonadaceae bacterium]
MNAKFASLALILAVCTSIAGAQKFAQPTRDDGQRRAALEQEFRDRGEQLVRERLNLTDDQVRRLRDVNTRLSGRRSTLVEQERTARVALRQEMGRGKAADQARVSQLMAQGDALQQQRIQLRQDEQKELSAFLTPVQQAQYYGLQAQLRAKMREMRQQSGDTSGLGTP